MTGRQTVTIWWGRSRVEMDAWPTNVPGLVIHEDRVQRGVWVVTHAASGAGVLRLPEPEAALYAASRLAELADWSRPGSALRLLPGIEPKIWALARELGCYELTFENRRITDAELAEAETS